MTTEQFNKLPYGEIFASGTIENSPEGLFMTDGGGTLRWIAKKGGGDDWAIYCGWSWWSWRAIKERGDKVKIDANILKCLPDCHEILRLYRL